MDRTALILAALAARAGDTAPEVRDAQAALMAQLRMRFAGRAKGEAALASYEESAPGWEAALGRSWLRPVLTEMRARWWQTVMSVADAPGWRAGKYTI